MITLFVPGGMGPPELFILLFMAVFYVGIPLLGIVAVFYYLDGKRGYDERISTLERRVEELEDERS